MRYLVCVVFSVLFCFSRIEPSHCGGLKNQCSITLLGLGVGSYGVPGGWIESGGGFHGGAGGGRRR